MSRIIAAAIIKDGNVLIAKRNYGSLSGYWEFPGGKVEGDETDVACLIREIKEEFSVKLKVKEFLGGQQFFVDKNEYKMILFHAVICDENFRLSVYSEIVWSEKEQLHKYRRAPVDKLLVQQGCLDGLA